MTKKQMAIKESEEENKQAKEWNVEKEVVKDNSNA